MAGDYARSLTQSETGVAWQPLRVEIHIGVGYIPATNLCGITIPLRPYYPFLSGKQDTWKNAWMNPTVVIDSRWIQRNWVFILATSNDTLIVEEESAFHIPQINGKIAIFSDKAAEPKLHSNRSTPGAFYISRAGVMTLRLNSMSWFNLFISQNMLLLAFFLQLLPARYLSRVIFIKIKRN